MNRTKQSINIVGQHEPNTSLAKQIINKDTGSKVNNMVDNMATPLA